MISAFFKYMNKFGMQAVDIDIQNGVVIYQRSRINKPILNYVEDDRSNKTSGDPHASVYISNQVNLKNPATSLKVLIAA